MIVKINTAATTSVRIIIFLMSIFIIAFSRYAFMIFMAAMLPSLVAIFLDRTEHKCRSATICSFNLIGMMPYFLKLWDISDIAVYQNTITDIRTWLVIYGVTSIGNVLYYSLPLLISTIYVIKSKARASDLRSERNKICAEWGIKSDSPYEKIQDVVEG